MQKNRLEKGGRIDRSETLSFSFDGKRYQGFAGDTVASALLANDVSIVGRSFKYHRPRGIVAAGSEEPNAIFQLGTGSTAVPNLRATQIELYDALSVRSTRGWPNVKFDVGIVNNMLGRILGAGFYYKTFMYPRRFWGIYEHLIRRAAGFGTAPTGPDPDRYSHRNAHCDVLVVGGGPTGLMAARVAAKTGARVIIADEQNEFGGSLLGSRESIDDRPAGEWIESVCQELDQNPKVTRLSRTDVFGYYDHNFLTLLERCTDHVGNTLPGQVRQRLWRLRARQVVLAQGAFERPLVFSNNDRPGVMLASAVSSYINRYAVLPGRRAVVFANNDSAYHSAFDLKRAGADVVAIVDSRAQGGLLTAAATAAGIPVHPGSVVVNVGGRSRVTEVEVAKYDPDSFASNPHTLKCDLLAISGGWSPAVHLHSQSGGRNVWDDAWHCFVPGENVQGAISAGSGNGAWTLGDCLQQGLEAGEQASTQCGFGGYRDDIPKVEAINPGSIEALWRVPGLSDPDSCPKQFIDYQIDTTVSDVRLAAREGYKNVEHVKRYTAMGFGTDQGKLGNINGMAVLAECLGKPIQEVGTTTFRPAYTPVTFGACAGENLGELYDPVRKTALHKLHVDARAEFEVVGQWLRPWYFPRSGESIESAVARECLAVRNSLGIMDASTLGKIDVRGPDALEFLERIYTHNISKMKTKQCAYGILLGEDGMVKDDGVMARLADNHFYLTTTTGGAATVFSWLELWLQTEWPDLNVHLTSITDHFSTIAVAGPKSRHLLQKLGCSINLEQESFPFMTVREGELGGLPVQLFRVSFSGELAFEVNIDSNYATSMWQRLMEAGREFHVTPYGTETMHVLRAEKGFAMIGQDTDGSVTPVDLGMNWLLAKDKDYLGKRSLERSDCKRVDRKQYVGLVSTDNQTPVPEGSQLVNDPDAPIPVPMCGHVTSSYTSAWLGHPIALGLVSEGRKRKGETIFAMPSDGRKIPMKIVSPVFYDPKAERQRG